MKLKNQIKTKLKIILFSFIFFNIILTTMSNATSVSNINQDPQTAIFAMGCFWCGEAEFRDNSHNLLPGIIELSVGYAGGTHPNPTYENHPGYKEALKIIYDPNKITYQNLLNIFWKNIDLFDQNGQFCDKGFAYTSAIYFTNSEQKAAAVASLHALQANFDKQIVTEILPATSYFIAEKYHQNYKAKNPIRYKFYRYSCGRDARLKQIWSK